MGKSTHMPSHMTLHTLHALHTLNVRSETAVADKQVGTPNVIRGEWTEVNAEPTCFFPIEFLSNRFNKPNSKHAAGDAKLDQSNFKGRLTHPEVQITNLSNCLLRQELCPMPCMPRWTKS